MRPTLPLPLVLAAVLPAQDGTEPLRTEVRRLTAPFLERTGDDARFRFTLRARSRARPKTPPVGIVFDRLGPQSLRVEVRSRWASATLWRTAERTMLTVPEHGVVFVAQGELGAASLAPRAFLVRLLGARSVLPGLLRAKALGLAGAAKPGDGEWRLAPDLSVARIADGLRLRSERRGGLVEKLDEFDLTLTRPSSGGAPATKGLRTERVPRKELERMIFRGVRRALSIRLPEAFGIRPPRPRKVPHGELRLVDGHRVALLHGTPEQIGRAHAQLLGDECVHTVDSCLHLVGLIETVRSGRWFPGVLDEAWQRLSPHIPERHKRELDAIADAVPELGRREARLGNVFPEYFHCSGFAVFGKATKDGTLYHGRVLDYMTLIGLQHAAVSFVVKPAGYRGFLNVGYAGFVGSVTGMNERQISLGEMGGHGRGKWDGVPMATLMRRALEECDTLDDVCRLWRTSPRTCEYYYVFADGKGPDARAVAATPERIEFLEPGAAHERLGAGITDTVFISAGNRLARLRKRIEAAHGRIDARAAMSLMDRPVSMSSNLHNALMVPQRGLAWVANASDDGPAATQRYSRVDFKSLLREIAPRIENASYRAHDTLEVGREKSADARAMLADLCYDPAPFPVEVRLRDGESDATVTFPSPKPRGDARNDRVVMEWYEAKGRDRQPRAPAMVVLHILDGRMRVARAFARGMSRRGIHAFVVHLPDYGERGTPAKRKDVSLLAGRLTQGIADVRRARDAVAVLPGVDPKRVGLQGTSLGAFAASVAGALDGGFERVFLALGGGDLFGIISNGKKDSARFFRRLRLAGLGDDEIRTMFRRVEPLRLAHRLDPRRTYLYSARADQVVPAQFARALGQAAGLDAEHHFWVSGNHYTCAVHMPRLLGDMIERMKAR